MATVVIVTIVAIGAIAELVVLGVLEGKLQRKGLLPGGQCVGTTLAIDGCADDASGISCAFAAGVEALDSDVLERLAIADDADGG